ncbi:MAG: helix-turn-helix domain-containing protein [Gammaproteobacteria bacterium]|nr:helix-turn-helix domain-containing protein [Gammaproteobacteria bacterium]
MTSERTPCTIVVVAFQQVIPFHLSVPCIVFGASAPGTTPFKITVCAGEAGRIMTSAGFGLTNLVPLKAIETADVVIVPGWRDELDEPPERLLSALRRAHERGAQIVGLCLGTYVLAAAGLLDGGRATTHWEFTDRIAARFPAVDLDPDVLYVEHNNVLTSAGTAASLDVCLHMLRTRLGATEANRTARRLVFAPHRDGGQAQFIEQPLPAASGDCRLAMLMNSVRTRLREPHSVDTLASEARMSRRSFTRHFKALTGTSAAAWLLKERLLYSQRLLESSEKSIEAIADMAGFGSVASMRTHYRAAFGITPTVWRERFGLPVSGPSPSFRASPEHAARCGLASPLPTGLINPSSP